ncbi:hypothetical protein, partial [Helicobacter rodentium]
NAHATYRHNRKTFLQQTCKLLLPPKALFVSTLCEKGKLLYLCSFLAMTQGNPPRHCEKI